MNAIFSNLIGQERVKKRLSFYSQAYTKTCRIPAVLFVGPYGIGKTEFARQFSESLVFKREHKQFLEINCSTIKDLDYFIEEIYSKKIFNNNISILFDEAHCLPEDVINAFLTILNTENFKNDIRRFIYKDATIIFDFSKVNFIFATTESNKLFKAFRDRLTLIDFETYSQEELYKILFKNISGVSFAPGIIDQITSIIRSNPRNAIQRSNEIELFCKSKNIRKFSEKNYKEFLDNLGILPYGLTNSELQILKLLNEKERSLNSLAASTGLSRAAIQRDHEMFLLQKDLIEIDVKRKITFKGRQILEEIKKIA
jgi:Holliday junction resolvasome RuvABC ATP-dependent DNA helicase subunit